MVDFKQIFFLLPAVSTLGVVLQYVPILMGHTENFFSSFLVLSGVSQIMMYCALDVGIAAFCQHKVSLAVLILLVRLIQGILDCGLAGAILHFDVSTATTGPIASSVFFGTSFAFFLMVIVFIVLHAFVLLLCKTTAQHQNHYSDNDNALHVQSPHYATDDIIRPYQLIGFSSSSVVLLVMGCVGVLVLCVIMGLVLVQMVAAATSHTAAVVVIVQFSSRVLSLILMVFVPFAVLLYAVGNRIAGRSRIMLMISNGLLFVSLLFYLIFSALEFSDQYILAGAMGLSGSLICFGALIGSMVLYAKMSLVAYEPLPII